MNDRSLAQLIETLKSEAIEAAEKESAMILENARLQARQMLEQAQEKRNAMLVDAKQEAEAMLRNGENALRQASRDFSIAVRNELIKVFQAVLEEETRKEFTPDLLITAIVKVIENIGDDVELHLSPEFSEELSGYIHNCLKSSDEFITILENSALVHGFSVRKTNQGWSYTVTPEDVANALSNHLNHSWRNILHKGA